MSPAYSSNGLRSDPMQGGPLWAAVALLLCLIVLRCMPIWGVRFTTGDESWASYIWFTQQIQGGTRYMASDTGRLYFLLSVPVYAFVTQLKSNFAYNLLNLGSFVLGSCLPALVLIGRVRATSALLFLVFYFAFFPVLWHLPPASYPVAKYYPLILAALAVVCLHAYLDERPGWTLPAACLFYFAAIFQYESITIAVALYVSFALALELGTGRVEASDRWFRRAAVALGSVAILYGALYLAWRAYHPSAYPGTQMAPFDLDKIAAVTWKFAVGSIVFFNLGTPLTDFYGDATTGRIDRFTIDLSLPALRNAMTIEYALAGMAAFGAVALLLGAMRARRQRTGVFLLAIVIGLLLAVGGNVLQGLTVQYQQWLEVKQTWVGGRVSYFGLILMLVALVVALRQLLWPRILTACLGLALAGATAWGAMLASVQNDAIARQMRMQTAKWDSLNLALGCAPIAQFLTGKAVLAPRLEDNIGDAPIYDLPDYWQRWIRHRFGLDVGLHSGFEPKLPPRPADALYDWRVDDRGRTIMALVAGPDGGATLPVLLAIRQPWHGWITYQAGSARRSRFVAPEQANARCFGDHAYLLQLDPPVAIDTITPAAMLLTARFDRFRYVPGELVQFSTEIGSSHRVAGWSHAEPGGMWSVVPAATLRLHPTERPANGFELVVSAHAFLPPGADPLEVQVSANGSPVATWRFEPGSARESRSAFIPASLLGANNELELRFQNSALHSPSEIGSVDTRTLGIFLQDLVLRPE